MGDRRPPAARLRERDASTAATNRAMNGARSASRGPRNGYAGMLADVRCSRFGVGLAAFGLLRTTPNPQSRMEIRVADQVVQFGEHQLPVVDELVQRRVREPLRIDLGQS